MNRFKDYNVSDLDAVSAMLAAEELSDGSKLSLLTAEYHKLHQKKERLEKERRDGEFGDFYPVLVSYKKVEKLALEEDRKRKRASYSDICKELRELKAKVKAVAV